MRAAMRTTRPTIAVVVARVAATRSTMAMVTAARSTMVMEAAAWAAMAMAASARATMTMAVATTLMAGHHQLRLGSLL